MLTWVWISLQGKFSYLNCQRWRKLVHTLQWWLKSNNEHRSEGMYYEYIVASIYIICIIPVGYHYDVKVSAFQLFYCLCSVSVTLFRCFFMHNKLLLWAWSPLLLVSSFIIIGRRKHWCIIISTFTVSLHNYNHIESIICTYVYEPTYMFCERRQVLVSKITNKAACAYYTTI